MSTSLEIEGLTLQRPGGFRLGPLGLTLAAGSRTALVGPSGCGKTTLLRCIAGLVEPDAGVIRIGGRTVLGDRRTMPAEARGIGLVFQDGALWPHMTALGHLRFVAPRTPPDALRGLLDDVGLAAAADRRPGSLSGGEGQRLALARALAGDPDLLLLDEPLHSVDVHLRGELSLAIRRVTERRGLTTVVVTHDRDEALAVADDVVVLRAGQVVEAGSATRLLAAPRTAFGAAFLCGAACLPVTRDAGGRVRTPFGELAAPPGDDAQELVMLPGDVGVAASANGAAPRGRVMQVRPGVEGPVATVEFAGQILLVPGAGELVPGAEIALELRRPPRFLPSGGTDPEVSSR